MAKIYKNTLVVVADSEKALFMRNLTDNENPNFDVTDTETQDNPSDIEQSANRPGRMSDGGPGPKSAFDDTDWHELAKDRFASDLADRLYDEAIAGKYERLVLVASPQVLGVVRDEMHMEVSKRLVADIDKTLTNHPVEEIERIVKKELKAA